MHVDVPSVVFSCSRQKWEKSGERDAAGYTDGDDQARQGYGQLSEYKAGQREPAEEGAADWLERRDAEDCGEWQWP